MQRGDQSAFEALYHRYWPEIYTMIYRRIGDREVAKDIVQDIFINLWRHRSRVVAERALAPWLNAVAKKQAVSWYRKEMALRRRETSYQEAETLVAPATTGLETGELHDILEREIEKMPANMKKSFRLSRYEDKSIREISVELSLSEQTVRNNISMALDRLKLQARKFYSEPANLAGVLAVLLTKI